jgi:hypothetical protein
MLDTFRYSNPLSGLLENEPENHGVGGSIPPLGTKISDT